MLSHPNKRLLDHLNNVKKIGLSIFDSKSDLKFSLFEKNDIRETLRVILYYHDFGKATVYFQEYLKSSVNGKEYICPKELINHSLLSAAVSYELIMSKIKNEMLAKLGFIAIRKHHGNLEDLDQMSSISSKKINVLKKQLDSIDLSYFPEIKKNNITITNDIKSSILWTEIEESLESYFLFNFLFSILIYSDKTDVIFGKPTKSEIPKDLDTFIDNYKKIKFEDQTITSLNAMRNEIYKENCISLKNTIKEGKIFSVNVPTGSGKTLIALNMAFKILKSENLSRIIYSLPFTSIVDQTEKTIKDIFEKNNREADKYLTVHHHLAEIKTKNGENYYEGDKAEFLIENWDKPIILTTFWQLFNSIISNRNSQLRKFHNISNSIIILDEAQLIPYKYWKLSNEIFKKFIEIFNCKIIFLTATMPLIFEEEKNEIASSISTEKRKRYFDKLSRYRINIVNNLNDINIEELFEISKRDIQNNKNKDFLFVFNTIKTSIRFFNKLREEFPKEELIYLSSNILPFQRQKRISKIKEENKKRKIVISTQVIEAGVDIDLDTVYRDFAPLDSIIQSAGRCNRNSKKEIGDVLLFKLINDKNSYDYAYIYKGLVLNATHSILKNRKTVYENEIYELIKEYYTYIKENSSEDESLDILEAIKKLQYDEMKNKFKLIDEIPSFLMFFEINEGAKKILKIFRIIMNIRNKFERKNKFLQIKKDFYKYVLSVRLSNQTKSYYTSFEEIGNLKIVENDLVESIYDYDTGLKTDWSVFI